MTKQRRKPESRSVEMQLEIHAPLEAVWKALTEAEELTRWFPPEASVRPGEGGKVRWSWGPPYDWESKIEIWEPHRHLRTTYEWAPGGAAPAALAMDFYLEGRGGHTVVRLVHSGFGAGSEWDDEYDGVSRGWRYELRSLRHYLENHRGTPRLVAWARGPFAVSYEEAWKRLMSPQGLLRQGRLENPREGDPYSITAATGDTLQGKVLTWGPPKAFSGTAENLNNALFRVHCESSGLEKPEAWVWLAAYGLPEAEVRAFQNRWRDLLTEIFPEPGKATS